MALFYNRASHSLSCLGANRKYRGQTVNERGTGKKQNNAGREKKAAQKGAVPIRFHHGQLQFNSEGTLRGLSEEDSPKSQSPDRTE
jgi:hypothetical protein